MGHFGSLFLSPRGVFLKTKPRLNIPLEPGDSTANRENHGMGCSLALK